MGEKKTSTGSWVFHTARISVIPFVSLIWFSMSQNSRVAGFSAVWQYAGNLPSLIRILRLTIWLQCLIAYMPSCPLNLFGSPYPNILWRKHSDPNLWNVNPTQPNKTTNLLESTNNIVASHRLFIKFRFFLFFILLFLPSIK